jgi:hypothetical protein
MIDTITITAISFASGVVGAAIGYLTCKNVWSKQVEDWRARFRTASSVAGYFAKELDRVSAQLEKHRATRDRHNKAKRDKRAAGRKQP